ncbi:hypothetical protein [Nonomuraea dietziae]|uniref:hypothetical protein n=1 Tax=Nonomuraea dietziae TaxID=65515 RepID=UPI0033DC6665
MLKKLSAIAATTVVLLGGVGVAAASVAAKAPTQYGACVSKTTGAMRLLEPNRLKKSQHGKCRSSERKIYLPTKAGLPVIPPPPATVVYKRVTGVETCTKTTDATLTYSCVTVPAPSPSPTTS